MKTYERSQHALDIWRLLARGEKEIEAGAGFEFNEILKEADHFLEVGR